jgi:hypothetical protein
MNTRRKVKDLSKVDIKDIAKDWDSLINGSPSASEPEKPKTILMPPPVRGITETLLPTPERGPVKVKELKPKPQRNVPPVD